MHPEIKDEAHGFLGSMKSTGPYHVTCVIFPKLINCGITFFAFFTSNKLNILT